MSAADNVLYAAAILLVIAVGLWVFIRLFSGSNIIGCAARRGGACRPGRPCAMHRCDAGHCYCPPWIYQSRTSFRDVKVPRK